MKRDDIIAYALNDNHATNSDEDYVEIEFGVETAKGDPLLGPYVRVDGVLYRVKKTEIDSCFLVIWTTQIADQEALDELAES